MFTSVSTGQKNVSFILGPEFLVTKLPRGSTNFVGSTKFERKIKQNFNQAIGNSENFIKNVSLIQKSMPRKQRGSSEYFHTQFLRPKEKVVEMEMGELAMMGAYTFRSIHENLRLSRQ